MTDGHFLTELRASFETELNYAEEEPPVNPPMNAATFFSAGVIFSLKMSSISLNCSA